MSFGIDVSHHQNPASLPWPSIKDSSSFCIVRATYGSKLRDRHCAEHMRRAREAGLKVGCYHFFRPSQPVHEQIHAFRAAVQAAGYQPGDIVPALDVEHDPIPEPGTNVGPAWEPGVRQFAEALAAEFGALPLIYITQREWIMLGKPSWVLDHPLWVAHYTNGTAATPGGKPWTIHQHRVAPYDPNGPGGHDSKRPELDQNRAIDPLPLSTRVPWGIVPAPVPAPEREEDDDGLDDAVLRAQLLTQQVDIVSPIVANAMREMAGLPTQPPDGGPDDAA
jgi:lysozyme